MTCCSDAKKELIVWTAYKELFGPKNSLLYAEVPYKQAMTHSRKLLFFRIPGVSIKKIDCNLFPVFYLSVWRKRKFITYNLFSNR